MILYHYWRSSASWRVRWALEIKKISHELRPINLLAGEDKTKDYLAKNPAGYVPCLVDGNFRLSESLAILDWLEEKYPAVSISLKDPNLKGLMRQLAETVNAGTQPLINLDVTRKVSDDKDAQMKWSQHWIRRGLGIYENLLQEIPRAGKLTFSDQPTIADICLIPQCYGALRNEVDLAEFPEVKKIYEYARTTDACKRAEPEAHQPKA